MSEGVEKLAGDALEVGATISKLAPRGMISIRGNLESKNMASSIKRVAGMGIPEARQTSLANGQGCLWMSPDELLVLVNYADVAEALSVLQGDLNGEHSLIVNVSDARVVFEIKGNNIRNVLAKLCPVDLSDQAFGPGQVRRTRISQVAGAIWMLDPLTIELACFRSSADYVCGLLKQAARKGAETKFY